MRKKERIIFLKGHKTILRPLDKQTDLDACVRWMNDPEVRRFISSHLPTYRIAEEKWFDELPDKKENITLAIETMGGKFIGIMGLHRIERKDGTATTGAVIGEKAYWGKGYGTDAKMALLHYAFNTENLRKIYSSAWVFNGRSIAYSKKCGYKIEGVRKAHAYIEGEYRDQVNLAVFKEDWLPIWNKYRKTGKVR